MLVVVVVSPSPCPQNEMQDILECEKFIFHDVVSSTSTFHKEITHIWFVSLQREGGDAAHDAKDAAARGANSFGRVADAKFVRVANHFGLRLGGRRANAVVGEGTVAVGRGRGVDHSGGTAAAVGRRRDAAARRTFRFRRGSADGRRQQRRVAHAKFECKVR